VYNRIVQWISRVLDALAIVSAAWLLVILIRKACRKAADRIRPLLYGVLFLDGIGLTLIVWNRLSRNAGSSSDGILSAAVMSMAANTAILLFKFGWLLAFLTFLRRFAFPLRERLYGRLAAAVIVPIVLLIAGGWIEFFLASSRDLFDNLQFVSDYFVIFAMIGASLYLRSRIAALVSRETAKAMIVLGGLFASIFLCLGLWWIVGGSVYRLSPALGAAFIPLMFFLFNGSLAVWTIRFSWILAGPESVRFDSWPVSDDLSSRWGISRREGEIIELVNQGLSNQEIAGRLFISLSTVKKHLNNVFLKTGVSNRVQLVRLFSRSVQDSAAESKPESKPERSNKP
jgi:DNA-binding CsgD family transcriptional regulator